MNIWSADNPGWQLIPHDWMWHAFLLSNGYILGVALTGFVLWVEWLCTEEDQP